MRKITGTIIKVNDDKAAIMTKDCEMIFIKKQPGMYLGLEIQFGANEIISSKKKVIMTIKIVSPIAAMLLLVFLNLHIFKDSDNYTYVCIDGEFSIEYTIDKDLKVVRATSVDKKIQDNLLKINLKSKPLQVALSAVLKNNNNFTKEGYTSNDCVIISAYTKQKNDEQRYTNKNIEKVLLACKDSVDEIDDKVKYRFVGINNDARKLAEKNNISMGRYYIFEKAQEQGKDISLEQAKDMQVSELIEKVKIPYLSIINETITSDENLPDVIVTENTQPKKQPQEQENQDKKVQIEHNSEVEESNTIQISTPIAPKTNDKREHPTPIPPKINDRKEPPTPIASKTNDKEIPTPVAPKIDDKKEHPTPIAPKTNDKEIPTPIAPEIDDKKEHPTPIAPKTNYKETPTPVVPKNDDRKEHPTPIAPKNNEKKERPTPIPLKEYNLKEPPRPIPPSIGPKADDKKGPPVPPIIDDSHRIQEDHAE